jgi:hypothetical protein
MLELRFCLVQMLIVRLSFVIYWKQQREEKSTYLRLILNAYNFFILGRSNQWLEH